MPWSKAVSYVRQSKLLEVIEKRARATEADLTAALAVRDNAPMRKLRKAAMAFVTDAEVAVREFAENEEFTPVHPAAPVTRGGAHESSSRFKAADVQRLLDEGKVRTLDEIVEDAHDSSSRFRAVDAKRLLDEGKAKS
jgi:hypothetical protein